MCFDEVCIKWYERTCSRLHQEINSFSNIIQAASHADQEKLSFPAVCVVVSVPVKTSVEIHLS